MAGRNVLNKVLNRISLYFSFIGESWVFWRSLLRNNASYKTWSDKEKMEYVILRQAHTLEKGMSMRNPREGFGQAKAEHLKKDMEIFVSRYGETASMDYPRRVLLSHSTSWADGFRTETAAGVKAAASGNFESLMLSRHSIRYFSREPVDNNLVKKALEIAAYTPSACNRQAWHTHIFTGEKAQELLHWQRGAVGFEEEIPMAILVCSDQKAFLSFEVHQAWVDGGLYSMNLINALHSLGLGTIPLSCGFSFRKLRQLRKFAIPDNQIPVLIIGVGNMEENFKCAPSERKRLEETNIWHE